VAATGWGEVGNAAVTASRWASPKKTVCGLSPSRDLDGRRLALICTASTTEVQALTVSVLAWSAARNRARTWRIMRSTEPCVCGTLAVVRWCLYLSM
jgi:hypothetical protein